MKADPPQPALRILDVGARVQKARVVHQQHGILLEHKPRHMLAHALGSVEDVVELLDRRVGLGVRRGRVVQYVLAEADVGVPRHGVDVEQLALDRVPALEELGRDLEVELVVAQHVDGLRGEEADQVAGPEDAKDAAAFSIWVDDVEAEVAGRALFEGAVGVPGEFAHRVRD